VEASPAGSFVVVDRPPDEHERLFVIFTRGEAEAVVRLSTDGRRTAAARQGVAKIQAALGPVVDES
jgi:hypothetical protein